MGLGLEGRVGVSWTGLYFGPMREPGTAEGYFLFGGILLSPRSTPREYVDSKPEPSFAANT